MIKVARCLAFVLLVVVVTVVLLHMRVRGVHQRAWLAAAAGEGRERGLGQAVARAGPSSGQRPSVPGGGTTAPCQCPSAGAANGTGPDSEAAVDDRSPESDPTHAADRPSPDADRPSGPSVIILTSMRTGSSFVGEIFGQNPDVFYLFEPGLALLTQITRRRGIFVQPQYVEMLKALYRCDTAKLDYYMAWIRNQLPAELVKKVPRVSELVCRATATGQRLRCGRPGREHFERACRESGGRAIKSIRVTDIGMLEPLIGDRTINLKVVHLVRDPRGMTASRVLAMNAVKGTQHGLDARSFTDEMRAYLLQYCAYSVDDLVAGYYLPRYRDNYMVLRYEDMALNPMDTARELYSFAGLGPVPEGVSRWLIKNTQTRGPGVYSTSRLSSREYQYWRTRLSLETTKAIEGMGRCAEMMQSFGYLPVRDDGHLKNLSSSLLDKLPGPSEPWRYALT